MSGIFSPVYSPVSSPVELPLWPGWDDIVNDNSTILDVNTVLDEGTELK